MEISLSSLHSLRTTSLNIFDTVWMLLFQQLSDLCINQQSAIRKSAAQTLFSTLTAHGSLLEDSTWKAVLWQVLFNVLKKVQQSTVSASTSSLSVSTPSIMIHHTRDTAQKQWAETQVRFLYFHSSIHLFIHPSIYPSIRLSIHPFIHSSIYHSFIHPFIYPFIH